MNKVVEIGQLSLGGEETEVRYCKKCDQHRPISYFYQENGRPDGLSFYCKFCIIANTKKYRTAHTQKVKDAKKLYGVMNKGAINKKSKEWRTANPERNRHNNLMWKFNVTIEQYNQMFAEQKGCCAICYGHQNDFKKALHVDHDHDTHQVRGLLCHRCNTALGLFRDKPEILDNGATYLRRWEP